MPIAPPRGVFVCLEQESQFAQTSLDHSHPEHVKLLPMFRKRSVFSLLLPLLTRVGLCNPFRFEQAAAAMGISTDDPMLTQASQLWEMMDEMAVTNPEGYCPFIHKFML